MDKQEAKSLINSFYQPEEENWNRALNQWYKPHGAPGRLSEELLEQWHRKERTGAIHPSDLPRHSIKVVYDEGRGTTIKNFVRRKDAIGYRNQLLTSGLCAVYITPEGEEDAHAV